MYICIYIYIYIYIYICSSYSKCIGTTMATPEMREGGGTADSTVAVMATKKLDYQLSNHSQLYSLFSCKARQQVFIISG